MDKPYFSIIIPTYNRRKIIGKTIESVLDQTHSDFEIIVVDDGSTDGTSEYLKQSFDQNLTIISIQNSERGKARNIGTNYANGTYVYFLDSDDLLYSNHLEVAQKFIKEESSPEWIFQEYEFVTEISGKRKQIHYNRRNPIKDLVINGNFLSCHGVFLRRDIADKYPFEENREMAGSEDYALWIELAARYPLYINRKITSALVQHDNRSVFNFKSDKLILRKQLMLEKVKKDTEVNKVFKKWLPYLEANTYTYLALHLAMINANKRALHFLGLAVKTAPASIIKKRTLAIFKHLLT